jgi:hypothetical protein
MEIILLIGNKHTAWNSFDTTRKTMNKIRSISSRHAVTAQIGSGGLGATSDPRPLGAQETQYFVTLKSTSN